MNNGQDFSVGGGNVFADLGHPDADLALAKADIAGEIAVVVGRQRWNQTQAASALKLTQPEVSDLLRGKLRRFSLERLVVLLTRAGQDVRIESRPNPEAGRSGKLGYGHWPHGTSEGLAAASGNSGGVTLD